MFPRLAIAALPAAAGLLSFLPFLSQIEPIAPTNWILIVLRESVAVGVLLIILFRLEPRLKALEISNDRQARAAFVLLVEQSVNEAVRSKARQEIADIDAKTPRP